MVYFLSLDWGWGLGGREEVFLTFFIITIVDFSVFAAVFLVLIILDYFVIPIVTCIVFNG